MYFLSLEFAKDVNADVYAAYAALPWALGVAFVVFLLWKWFDL